MSKLMPNYVWLTQKDWYTSVHHYVYKKLVLFDDKLRVKTNNLLQQGFIQALLLWELPQKVSIFP